MTLPWIEELREENWAVLSVDRRLAALNEMERALAQQETRKPCEVKGIPDESRRIGADGEPILRGHNDPIEKEIQIDPILLSGDRPPYQAVETYFHEARHAYQDYAIEHPEIHDGPEQVADWQKNDAAYIGEEDIELDFAKFSHYRWQPVEADANRIAYERTEELYTGMFQDATKQYQDYRTNVEKEIFEDIDYAVYEFETSDYEQEARLFMLSKHEAELDMQKQDSLTQTDTLVESSDSEEVEPGEDYGYYRGYSP